jgi:PEP-CTERM motif-containing protein
MLHALRVLLFAALLASPVGAATLSISSDKLTYNVGETMTLTVFGDDEGAIAYSIYGKLLYSGALVDNGPNNGTQFQTLLGPGWTKNVLLATDDGVDASIDAFGQISLPAQSADNLPGLLSTVTLIATAPGAVDVSWDDSAVHPGFGLQFFGLTSAPGTSFTIVPEPTTAALLGLGLLALAIRRRRM